MTYYNHCIITQIILLLQANFGQISVDHLKHGTGLVLKVSGSQSGCRSTLGAMSLIIIVHIVRFNNISPHRKNRRHLHKLRFMFCFQT